MSATVVLTIADPTASQETPTEVVWYDSEDGTDFSALKTEQISNLTDLGDNQYSWTLATADTTHYQLIKTKTLAGREADIGALLPPLPTNPGLQTIYGLAKEFGASGWAEGDTVTLELSRNDLVGGIALDPVTVTTTVGANGYFTVTADKGAYVTLKIQDATTSRVYFEKSFVVSDDDIANIKDC